MVSMDAEAHQDVKFPPHLPQPNRPSGLSDVTEFHLSGLKVTVKLPDHHRSDAFRGRITFFSRSNCRDSSAVRSFLRDRRLPYVEINLDVFPSCEADLRRWTSSHVPQIFLNADLVGGLVALNKMRTSGEFDRRVGEIAATPCPKEAPEVPVYGEEESEEGDGDDELAGIARAVRAKVEVRDRIRKMKIVRACFEGCELVEAVIDHLDCGRRKMDLSFYIQLSKFPYYNVDEWHLYVFLGSFEANSGLLMLLWLEGHNACIKERMEQG